MRDFLPNLWSNKAREELDAIDGWGIDEATVGALDRFAYWDNGMRDVYGETMQKLYNELEFDRDREANVASPSAPADWGPTDWTFTVYVIRFVFLHLLSRSKKETFESRPLSITLLDDMETFMNTSDEERTPSPHRERWGRDTPESHKRPIGLQLNCKLDASKISNLRVLLQVLREL
jgi:hypothetical protein